MSDIDPYVRTLFLRETASISLSPAFKRRQEIAPTIADHINTVLSAYNVDGITDIPSLTEIIIDELIHADVITLENHQFAGECLQFIASRYKTYREQVLRTDEISGAVDRIGKRYFDDVFSGYLASIDGSETTLPLLGMAPASSRIVTFSDNQIAEADAQATALIEVVEAQNQIAQMPGLRELLIGQLRAGRELIRAGSFRLYALQITLLGSLSYLAKRYEKEAIGALASALLALLMKHIGIDA